MDSASKCYRVEYDISCTLLFPNFVNVSASETLGQPSLGEQSKFHGDAFRRVSFGVSILVVEMKNSVENIFGN